MLSARQLLLMRRARDRTIDIAIAPLGTVILLPDPDFRRRVCRCVSHVGLALIAYLARRSVATCRANSLVGLHLSCLAGSLTSWRYWATRAMLIRRSPGAFDTMLAILAAAARSSPRQPANGARCLRAYSSRASPLARHGALVHEAARTTFRTRPIARHRPG